MSIMCVHCALSIYRYGFRTDVQNGVKQRRRLLRDLLVVARRIKAQSPTKRLLVLLARPALAARSRVRQRQPADRERRAVVLVCLSHLPPKDQLRTRRLLKIPATFRAVPSPRSHLLNQNKWTGGHLGLPLMRSLHLDFSLPLVLVL